MVAKHLLVDWADDLQTAHDLILKVEVAMLKEGFIRIGQATQDRLSKCENRLGEIIWLIGNNLKQPSLFEKEPPVKNTDGSEGGAPWD